MVWYVMVEICGGLLAAGAQVWLRIGTVSLGRYTPWHYHSTVAVQCMLTAWCLMYDASV